MSRKGGEIAALKQAEQEAALLINAARDERKVKMRGAQADAKKEIDEYKSLREAKLRTVQPEAQALEQKVARVTRETDMRIAALENEYQRNKEPVLQMLMAVVMSIENPFSKQ